MKAQLAFFALTNCQNLKHHSKTTGIKIVVTNIKITVLNKVSPILNGIIRNIPLICASYITFLFYMCVCAHASVYARILSPLLFRQILLATN